VQGQETLSKLKIGKVEGIIPLWPVRETEPVPVEEKTLGVYLEHEKEFTWVQEVLVASNAPTGPVKLPIQVDAQVCDKDRCLPPEAYALVATFHVSMEAPLELPEALRTTLKERETAVAPTVVPVPKAPAAAPVAQAPPAPAAAHGEGVFGLIKDSQEEYRKKMEAVASRFDREGAAIGGANADGDLVAFLLAGIFWGGVSLITPCVFPMIPITVSFFMKQSEKEHHRPIVMASVYSLTIVVVLTLAAAFLLSVFRLLSVHPATNYFLGALFIFFALSLFGMYEIELPSGLARYTSSHEGQGGLVGTMFMALTFTIISFACVAPFLGGFGGTAASSRPLWHNLLGGLAFSATFAAPFFLLALFPTLLRSLPKSGSWLNSVKVIMGFLELAAALKFFRSAELVQTAGAPSVFTYDYVLGVWIALCLLSSLYLIGMFRLPHDSPLEHIGVPRLLFSIAFLALALYLLPALFKVDSRGRPQRPAGFLYAWIDSFLLPEDTDDDSVQVTGNLPFALEEAEKARLTTGKPRRIFLDFTGKTCTNCKINEKSVFPKRDIRELLDTYLMVQLYTDTVPATFYAPALRAELERNAQRALADAKEVNLPFQKRVFDDEQLPLYAIVEPQDNGRIKVLAVYDEGRINNEASFADFLREPEKWAQRANK
jgi:thiol:disulfide interchange protein